MRHVPPSIFPKITDRAMYEGLQRHDRALQSLSLGLSAVQRGNTPTSSQTSIVTISGGSDHHTLSNLTVYDDHPQYLYLNGRLGGQKLYDGLTVNNLITPTIQITTSPSSGYYLKSDSTGMGTWAALPATPNTFLDSVFRVYNSADQTKGLKLDLSFLTTGTIRTWTVPDADGTLTINEQLGQNPILFYDGALTLQQGSGDGSFIGTIHSPSTLAGNRHWTFPDTTGTILLTSSSAPSTFSLISNSTSAGVAFADTTTSSKKLRMVLTEATGNNSFTFNNTNDLMDFNLKSYGGLLPIVGANTSTAARSKIRKLDLTSQTAAIGSTNMTSSATAGYYKVDYTLAVTTAQAGDVSVQFQINYTDDVGLTNQTSGTPLVLTATGRQSGVMSVYLASGELSYQTNVVTQTNSRYALRVRVTYLG